MVMLSLLAGLVVAGVAFASYMFKVVNEYERGVRFTLGKYDQVLQPGLRIVIPFVQTWNRVDMRVKAVDVPKQESITKDNVTVSINAVIYYKVRDAEKAVIEVERYMYAVKQLAQTTMRNVVGQVDLDELLARRDKIAKQIREVIDEQTDPWGIDVHSVELKDIILAEDMKRVLARQAEAERERRAVMIQAEGEKEAAQNMADAAEILSERNGALHLRTLQTLASLSSDHSNTVVFTVPMEVLEAVKEVGQAASPRPDATPDSSTPVDANGSSSAA